MEESPVRPIRVVEYAVALWLPLAGLILLLVRPSMDMLWGQQRTHFWLVLTTAVLSAILAYATGEAAVRRGDARVLHVSLAFLSSAGFLGLHALATPGVLLSESNTGFVIATPVGVAIGALFAVRSTVELSGDAAVREVRIALRLRLALVALMVVWGILSIAALPPFDTPMEVETLPLLIAIPAVILYLYAAARYAVLWRQRPSLLLLTMMSAFTLLAEAMVSMALGRAWHLSWWEWHVLLLTAFLLVAYGARVSWREERFGDLYLEQNRAGFREMSVLFADLQGFTTFSEAHEPAEVAAMLNEYFAVGVPAVVSQGGEVHQIIGDALMVTFNRRGDQPDHAERAGAAGLALQKATAKVAAAHPEWPRFRVGINSGPVSVSLLGTTGGRVQAIVGDMVNTASRIEGQAPAGGVAIGEQTRRLIPGAETASLGDLTLKGKSTPVEAHLLVSLQVSDRS